MKKYKETKHCYLCNKCVELWDHHCIWTNNCIGKENIKTFIAFLVFTLLNFVLNIYIGIYCKLNLFNKIIMFLVLASKIDENDTSRPIFSPKFLNYKGLYSQVNVYIVSIVIITICTIFLIPVT